MKIKTAIVSMIAVCTATIAHAEIKIGASLSMSGGAGFLGDPEAKTLELLVEEVNAKGGVNGEELKLVLYDDGGDPNKARTFATRLVENDEVVAIIGGSTTGTSMAILEIAQDEGVPFVSVAGGLQIIEPVRSYVFKIPHTDRMACEKIFTDMQRNGISKIGLISGTDGFGASMEAQCKLLAESYGIEILASETYAQQDADVTPQLTKLRATDGIQAIVNPGFGQGSAIVARNRKQLGIDIPLYQSHGNASDGYIEIAGAEAVEGVRLPGTALLIADALPADDPQRNIITKYQTSYEARYGEEITTFGAYAYDAFNLIADAVVRAGSDNPKEIRDALENTRGFVGLTGVFNYSQDDHLGLDLSAFKMVEVRNGSWVSID